MKPTVEEVRAFLVKLTETTGWIGEGDDVARDIIDFIDGDPMFGWHRIFEKQRKAQCTCDEPACQWCEVHGETKNSIEDDLL